MTSAIESLASRRLGTAERVTVLVLGDVMLDRYVTGTVDRISPEAPVPVVRERRRWSVPGGAANVAAGIKALGAGATLVGVVGDDDDAQRLRGLLEERGVEEDGLATDPSRPTTRKTRILSRHQQVLRIDREDPRPLSDPVAEVVLASIRDRVREADVVVIQDYDKGTLSPSLLAETMRLAESARVPVVVDPKLRHFFDFRGAAVFKPNRGEVAAAIGVERFDGNTGAMVDLAERVGCAGLVVTMGAGGMLVLGGDHSEVEHIPSVAREVYDVSGAGDTVTAVLAVALAGGAELTEAAALANTAAGVSVGRVGAQPVSREDIILAAASERSGD